MKRTAALWVLLAAGCSNAPIADLLDWLKPGQLPPEHLPPYGGVGAVEPVIGIDGGVEPPMPVFPGSPSGFEPASTPAYFPPAGPGSETGPAPRPLTPAVPGATIIPPANPSPTPAAATPAGTVPPPNLTPLAPGPN